MLIGAGRGIVNINMVAYSTDADKYSIETWAAAEIVLINAAVNNVTVAAGAALAAMTAFAF